MIFSFLLIVKNDIFDWNKFTDIVLLNLKLLCYNA